LKKIIPVGKYPAAPVYNTTHLPFHHSLSPDPTQQKPFIWPGSKPVNRPGPTCSLKSGWKGTNCCDG